ncbi:MAG TPA: biotin transporter BioY [Actinobacteria bacterium]|nr:biotin transporter BioY [Actinomycetota bacterium]
MKLDVRSMILTALFAALTAVGALMVIPLPFSPVPVTLQVFFVLFAGALLGSKLGAVSQIVYVFLGCLGLPVFAGGTSGFGVLIGPTGGYIFGFILAAYVIGKLTEKKPRLYYFGILAALIVGVLIIYLAGVLQLMMVAKLNFSKAFFVGVLPFIGVDLIKAVLVSFLIQRVKPHVLKG